jgi:hypothetical protein
MAAPTQRSAPWDGGYLSLNGAMTFTEANLGNPQNGDIVVVSLYLEDNVTVTPPAGWSSTFAGVVMESPAMSDFGFTWLHRMYWIRRGASAPSYTFTWSGQIGGQVGGCAYVGARASGDPWSFADMEVRTGAASTAWPTAAGTTLDADNRLIWNGTQLAGSSAYTPPTGFTSAYGHDDMYWSERTQATAGAVSAASASWTGTAAGAVAMLLALRPAVAGGTDATATPAAFGVPMATAAAAPSGTASGTAAPAVFTVPEAFPAAVATGGSPGSTSPAVWAVPVAFAAASPSGTQSATPSPGDLSVPVSTPASSPTGGAAGGSFSFTFDQADGAFTPLADYDGPGGLLQLVTVGNRLSTNNSTALYGGGVDTGLTLTGNFQVDFDVHAPLGIGEGGATVGLLNGSFIGWRVFCGNATHIQKAYPTAGNGSHDNVTNDGRSATDQHITFTRNGTTGRMVVYADGVQQGEATDLTQTGGQYLFVYLSSSNSPTFETWIDNLVVKDYIGTSPDGTAAPAAQLVPIAASAASPSVSAGSSPAVWSVPVALDQAAASVAAAAAPADLAVSVALPASSTSGEANASTGPATFGATVTLPAAAVEAGSTVTVASFALDVTLPAAATSAGGSSGPAELAVPVTFPASSLSAGVTVSVVEVAVPVGFPAGTATGGNAGTVSPAVFAVDVTAPTAGPSGTSDATTAPDAYSVTVGMDPSSAAGGSAGTAGPAVFAVDVSQPSGAASGTSDAVSSPGAYGVAVSMDPASASGAAAGTTTPATFGVLLGVDQAVPSAGATTFASLITITVDVPAGSASGGSAAVAAPATITIPVTIDAPALSAGSTLTPEAIAVVLDVLDLPASSAVRARWLAPVYLERRWATPYAELRWSPAYQGV